MDSLSEGKESLFVKSKFFTKKSIAKQLTYACKFIFGLSCILEMNGLDPIMATFKVCDTNGDNGLIMEEIKQNECKKTLNKIFGLSTDMLQDTFFRLDENMDRVISKEEGQAASQSLERTDIIKEIKEKIKDAVDKATTKVKDAVDKLPGKPVSTKILVVTGGKLTTEIIDLENSSFGCTKVGKFPKYLYFASGGLVDNIPMVCGGTDGKDLDIFEKACYTLQENGGAWKEDKTATLIREKQNFISGSVVSQNKLFIPEFVGKKGTYSKHLNFEMVAPNKKSETLKPMNIWGHLKSYKTYTESCIVNWDANTLMLIGGQESQVYPPYWKDTFFINMGNKTVTPGPKLMERRSEHACHEMTVKGESFIIVTGGYGQSGWLKSTEFLSKSSLGKGWQKGNKGLDSPVALVGHQMVASYDKTKLYTIGGKEDETTPNKKIYQLSCDDKLMTKCKWTEMPTKLKEGRFGHVVFPISNKLTKKLCN